MNNYQKRIKGNIEKFEKELRNILYLSHKGKGQDNDDIYDLVKKLKKSLGLKED